MKLIKSKKLLKISAVVLSLVLLCGAMSATVSAGTTVDESKLQTLTIKGILENTIGWALGLIGLVSIVFIIYAGIKWVLSEGVQTKQDEARKMLTASVIGLVIALAAYAIVTVIMTNIFK